MEGRVETGHPSYVTLIYRCLTHCEFFDLSLFGALSSGDWPVFRLIYHAMHWFPYWVPFAQDRKFLAGLTYAADNVINGITIDSNEVSPAKCSPLTPRSDAVDLWGYWNPWAPPCFSEALMHRTSHQRVHSNISSGTLIVSVHVLETWEIPTLFASWCSMAYGTFIERKKTPMCHGTCAFVRKMSRWLSSFGWLTSYL